MIKYLLHILFVLCYFVACSPNKNNDSDFNRCLEIVDEYDTYQGPITDTTLAMFYFAIEYLERITNIESSCVISDVPFYKTRFDCKSDQRKWRKWYNDNFEHLTQEISDSLKREVAKENIWWNDSTILQYIFSE